MKSLFQKLIQQNVHITLDRGSLAVKVPKTGVDPTLIEEIKRNKQGIIDYLTSLNDPSKSDIPSIEPADSYPASMAQLRIWQLSKFKGGLEAFNLPGTIEIHNHIDHDKFIQALLKVIERHEILRTVFNEDEKGELEQIVKNRKEVNFDIKFVDKTGLEDEIGNFINQDAFVPFDLENGPLFRARLFKSRGDYFIFYYNMHGIIADGESVEIFTREAMAYYEAFISGKPISLAELAIHYKDVTKWQIDSINSESFREHENYWTKRLKKSVEPATLLVAQPRPAKRTFNGKLIGLGLGMEKTEKIQSFVEHNGGSIFAVLVALWDILIYRLSGSNHVTIGIPALGRSHSDLENQIGPYINDLPFALEINPALSFTLFYREVQDLLLKSFSFQMYPYEKMVADHGLDFTGNRNPFFDIRLVLQREEQVLEDFDLKHVTEDDILELGIGKKYVDTTFAKYDLEVDFRLLGGALWLNANYNTDIFKRDTVEQTIKSFKNLIQIILESPGKPIAALLSKFEILARQEHNH